jgi:hypothetical protein
MLYLLWSSPRTCYPLTLPVCDVLAAPRLPEAAVPVLKFFNQTDFKIQDRYEGPNSRSMQQPCW